MIMHAGEILRRRGLLSEDQLRQSMSNDGGVIQSAVELGYVEEAAALQALAEEAGLEFVDLREYNVDLETLKGFPQKLIYRHSLFPIARQDGSIVVATADPLDLYPLDEASAAIGCHLIPVVAERGEIARLVKRHLGVGSETIEGLVAAAEDEDDLELLDEIETDGSELSEMAQEASVVRLVNEILLEAIESRASDIHVESQSDGLVIRYRIDGILHPQPVPPEINRFQAAIISRLKIMARLNIAEKRLPQDGRIKLRVHAREVDIRVSVIPMIHGESLVMRILDKGSMVFDLRGLGMSEEVYKTYHDLIRLPHGIVLVTGPTGSGKTVSLYTGINILNQPGVNISTAEDPVEINLAGINQVQVDEKTGMTFAKALKAFLRQDPDIILVGEIRDLETGGIALKAAMTGHMVMSTLHTNDAPQTLTRMVDMGLPVFGIATSVNIIIAQRLARRLCKNCIKPLEMPKEALLEEGFTDKQIEAGIQLSTADGCDQCNAGYKGRTGIYQVMPISDPMRRLIMDGATAIQLADQAQTEGIPDIRQAALKKVADGITDMKEINRVTQE